jgi:hypothetical protein
MALDMSQFLVAAWARHPDLIPNEVGGIVPEPVKPFMERAPSLFLKDSELIHSKCDTLQFRVLIRVIEAHDYSIPVDSDDDVSESSDDSGSDGIPGPEPSLSTSLHPWPRIYRLAGDLSLLGEAWSSLPCHGGGVAWSPSSPRGSFPSVGRCPTPQGLHHARPPTNEGLTCAGGSCLV